MLRTGDILFFKGDSIVSKLIRKATSGEVNHVAIIYDDNTVFETDGSWGKAKFQPLSRYNGKDIFIYRYKGLTEVHEDEVKSLCHAYEGTPYSYWDIIVKGTLCWLPGSIRGKIASALGNKSFMICNELIMRIMWEVTQDPIFENYEASNPAKLRQSLKHYPLISRVL